MIPIMGEAICEVFNFLILDVDFQLSSNEAAARDEAATFYSIPSPPLFHLSKASSDSIQRSSM